MRLASWKTFLFAGLILALGSAACAADPPADSPSSGNVAACAAAPAGAGDEVPVLFAGFIDKIFSPLNGVLGNRKAMIQVGFVGMLLALYIIWWRRH